PWFDEYPWFCGAQSRLAVSAGKKDRFRGNSGPSVSGNPKTVSPERGKSIVRGIYVGQTGEKSRRSVGPITGHVQTVTLSNPLQRPVQVQTMHLTSTWRTPP